MSMSGLAAVCDPPFTPESLIFFCCVAGAAGFVSFWTSSKPSFSWPCVELEVPFESLLNAAPFVDGIVMDVSFADGVVVMDTFAGAVVVAFITAASDEVVVTELLSELASVLIVVTVVAFIPGNAVVVAIFSALVVVVVASEESGAAVVVTESGSVVVAESPTRSSCRMSLSMMGGPGFSSDEVMMPSSLSPSTSLIMPDAILKFLGMLLMTSNSFSSSSRGSAVVDVSVLETFLCTRGAFRLAGGVISLLACLSPSWQMLRQTLVQACTSLSKWIVTVRKVGDLLLLSIGDEGDEDDDEAVAESFVCSSNDWLGEREERQNDDQFCEIIEKKIVSVFMHSRCFLLRWLKSVRALAAHVVEKERKREGEKHWRKE